MTPADHLAFVLAVMAAGRLWTVTPEPSRTNGSCRCSDCHTP